MISSLDQPPRAQKPKRTATPAQPSLSVDDIARVKVLLPLPFPGPLDYRVPDDMVLSPGEIVVVPLGRREELGCVWDDESAAPPDFAPPPARVVEAGKLRAVRTRSDAPPFPPGWRRFIDWVAAYTLAPPGLLLATALRMQVSPAPRPALGWVRCETPPDLRLTDSRRAVLAQASAVPLTTTDLARVAGVSSGVVRGLADAGGLRSVPMAPVGSGPSPDPEFAPPDLSTEQTEAAQVLVDAVKADRFQGILLEGVTGSGKTEVYLEAVAEALRAGRQALVLLPEIALSAQWVDRFARRFGTAPALWHSDLSPGLRRATWQGVLSGEARVVVGARSALFLPFRDLGVVVIDEEHETAFKQEDGFFYHGRDMGVVRASLSGVPAILVSATPSLETLANVESGRYRHLILTSRHGGATLPSVTLIDMRIDPPERGTFLSPVLVTAMEETMARGEQAMLFLNRRGYAPLTLCRSCGHRMQCPNCTAWLVEHRARGILTCHHCGHVEPIPETCPSCGAAGSLTPIGPGIERVLEEARARFPDARILVMASDTLGSPDATAHAVHQISNREVDLVIGTQIVAKGWHFPHLTLVGVVDADLGLGGGDLRAAERTVQLLHQVAGRAGRASAPGHVLLQSYACDHPVMLALASQDFRAFMDQEAAQRRPGHWPPYGRLAALIVSATSADVADTLANALGDAAPDQPGIAVLGPAPAPLAMLRGRHRRRLLLRAPRNVALQPILRAWRARVTIPGQARVDIDIDPVSFL